MICVSQPQCPIAKTDTDSVDRLSLADPLELEAVVRGIRAPQGICPGGLRLHHGGQPSELLPELLGHTRRHEGSLGGNTSSSGVRSFAAMACRTLSAMRSHCTSVVTSNCVAHACSSAASASRRAAIASWTSAGSFSMV